MQANEGYPQLPALRDLAGQGLDKLLAGQAEPAWVSDLRRSSWKQFQSLELPYWRRTNLPEFSFDVFRPAYGSVSISFPGQEGVIVRDLRAALRERPDLMDGALGEALKVKPTKFTALHGALWQDGVFVYVPRNVDVSEPVRVTYRVPEVGTAIFPHTLVVAEQGSRVTVIEEFVSEDLSDPALSIPVTEILVGDNAEVRYVSAQTYGKGVLHIGSQLAHLGRDARVWWHASALGGQTQHLDMEIRLAGNGSHADWLGLNYGSEQQNLLFAPTLRHVGLNTEGQINFRNVVDDSAYIVFDGLVKIEKGAQGTNSDLRDNALHLSPASRSDSIPGLEIDANDVKAGHGSTSGPIDEEQVFYLRSRGLPQAEAVRMVVMGFVAEIVEQIPVEDLRERVIGLVEAKI